MPKPSQPVLPKVAVAIISYNTAALTARAVQTVLASEGVELTVLVIDNHSTDRTLSSLRRRFQVKPDQAALLDLQTKVNEPRLNDLFPKVGADGQLIEAIETATLGQHELKVLLASENLGFGRANNLAAAWTLTDWVLFLNSDTEVKPGTILNLVHQFQRVAGQSDPKTAVTSYWQRRLDNLGILAAKLLNPDGSLQRQGGALPRLSNLFWWATLVDDFPGVNRLFNSYQHHLAEMRAIARRPLTKVGWVGGTAMMVSRPCLAEVGGFDPAIFMYGEDIDLCWRATQRHWDVAITSEAEVIHWGSASSSAKQAILGEIKALVYLWEKYHNRSEVRLLKMILRLGLRWRILIFGILHRYGQQRIYHEALALV